jgi:hypothetical protein
MKTAFSIVSALSIVLVITAAQANDECKRVKIKGEIDNNIVNIQSPNNLGDYTMGVADLKAKRGRKTVKLTCTLLGEPTGDLTLPGLKQYDHMIVCDDSDQSELSFRTGFVNVGPSNNYDAGFFPIPGLPILSDDEIDHFCGSEATVWFIERADVNEARRSKGLFEGAKGGLDVVGCVNIVGYEDDGVPIQEVNMDVSGKLCLPNW